MDTRIDTILKRHEFHIFDLEYEKILERVASYIELREDHLEYHIAYKNSISYDEGGIWEEESRNWRCTVLRSTIGAVNMFFNVPKKSWTVEVESISMDTSIAINFPKGREGGLKAKAMYDILIKYMLGVVG